MIINIIIKLTINLVRDIIISASVYDYISNKQYVYWKMYLKLMSYKYYCRHQDLTSTGLILSLLI